MSKEKMNNIITPDNLLEFLTERERQVLFLIAQGATSKEIGHKLGISHKTADAHRNHIKRKLRAENIAELVQCAILFGLIEPRCPLQVNPFSG